MKRLVQIIVWLLSLIALGYTSPASAQGPRANITSPQSGARVQGTVMIKGTAWHPEFSFYKVEYGIGPNPSEWTLIGTTHPNPVIDVATLVAWDTTRVPDGMYSLRLHVVRYDGNYDEYFVHTIHVANTSITDTRTPTEITILTPTLTAPATTIGPIEDTTVTGTPTPTRTPTYNPPLTSGIRSAGESGTEMRGYALIALCSSPLWIILLVGLIRYLHAKQERVKVHRRARQYLDRSYQDWYDNFVRKYGRDPQGLCLPSEGIRYAGTARQVTATEKYWADKRKRKLMAISTLGDLLACSPNDFEEIVGMVFDERGYIVYRPGLGRGDRGVDLVVSRQNRRAIVQCKRYKGLVAPHVVRDLAGTMRREKAEYGYVVTTGRFSSSTYKWAKDMNIALVDGETLVKWVLEAKSKRSEIGLKLARKCPRCGERRWVIKSTMEDKDDVTDTAWGSWWSVCENCGYQTEKQDWHYP